jgi:hypothetical protein
VKGAVVPASSCVFAAAVRQLFVLFEEIPSSQEEWRALDRQYGLPPRPPPGPGERHRDVIKEIALSAGFESVPCGMALLLKGIQ